jgi:hypothetical protein
MTFEARESMKRILRSTGILLAALAFAACQEANEGAGVSADTTVAPEAAPQGPVADADVSAGKPTAPIAIDYTVIGAPIVGQPVSINLEVSSMLPGRAVTLNYRINDPRNLSFPQAQAQRVALGVLGDSDRAAQQVTVVPQREGRLYLNVSAEVETEEGVLLKSIAIPIQVGAAPRELQTNGEVGEDAQGEAIVSMPADEETRD